MDNKLPKEWEPYSHLLISSGVSKAGYDPEHVLYLFTVPDTDGNALQVFTFDDLLSTVYYQYDKRSVVASTFVGHSKSLSVVARYLSTVTNIEVVARLNKAIADNPVHNGYREQHLSTIINSIINEYMGDKNERA